MDVTVGYQHKLVSAMLSTRSTHTLQQVKILTGKTVNFKIISDMFLYLQIFKHSSEN